MRIRVGTILFLAFFATSASAYTCWAPKSIAERTHHADAVFVGTVESVDDIGAGKNELGTERVNVLFRVDKIWKGIEGDPYIYADTESFYEYDFEKGKSYLVFAYNLYRNRLSIVGCPRTEVLTETTLAELGEPVVTLEQSGTSGVSYFSDMYNDLSPEEVASDYGISEDKAKAMFFPPEIKVVEKVKVHEIPASEVVKDNVVKDTEVDDEEESELAELMLLDELPDISEALAIQEEEESLPPPVFDDLPPPPPLPGSFGR